MRMSLCFLACSAVVLGVTLVVAAPHSILDSNLCDIIDQIAVYNRSHTPRGQKVEYVNSAREFAEGPGRCGQKFFCAVHDSLHKHSPKHKSINKIVANLNNYIRDKHINCTQALMNATRTTVELPMPRFLSDLEGCIRCRFLNTTSTSC